MTCLHPTKSNLNPPKKKKIDHKKTAVGAALLALLFALLAIVFSGWNQYQLRQTLGELKNLNRTLEDQYQKQAVTLLTFNQRLLALKTRLASLKKAHDLPWRLKEVNYVLHLADVNLTVSHHLSAALALMHLANQYLARLDDPRLYVLRQAIIHDIQRIQMVPSVDVSGILLQLSALQQSIDALTVTPPLVNQKPIKTAFVTNRPQGFRASLEKLIAQLKSFVVIRYHKGPDKALALSQWVFFKAEIKLALAKAEWALLNRDELLYQKALLEARQKLLRWDNVNPALSLVTHTLEPLARINIAPRYPNILHTLNLVKALCQKITDLRSHQPIDSLPVNQQSHRQTQPINKKPLKTDQTLWVPNPIGVEI